MDEHTVHETIKALHRADEILGAYLTDMTEEGFEEIPEVDDARLVINDVSDELKNNQRVRGPEEGDAKNNGAVLRWLNDKYGDGYPDDDEEEQA